LTSHHRQIANISSIASTTSFASQEVNTPDKTPQSSLDLTSKQ
jgi:hypothetical protein